MVAASRGYHQICQLLLEHGAAVDKVHFMLLVVEYVQSKLYFREMAVHLLLLHLVDHWKWSTFYWNMVLMCMQKTR